MIKFENTEVVGFEAAIRGMRNPKNSWDKSDSDFSDDCIPLEYGKGCEQCPHFGGWGNPCIPKIGENDLNLMMNLIKAGTDHRKFMRMIVVYVDITAPLYW